mmetsp:Transcript_34513/g.68129  ORF Transcript_34513/g.68129 Transcript_34513/m.68129 type:complete len:98 (-) Transcript_34513:1697-1990(-)
MSPSTEGELLVPPQSQIAQHPVDAHLQYKGNYLPHVAKLRERILRYGLGVEIRRERHRQEKPAARSKCVEIDGSEAQPGQPPGQGSQVSKVATAAHL